MCRSMIDELLYCSSFNVLLPIMPCITLTRNMNPICLIVAACRCSEVFNTWTVLICIVVVWVCCSGEWLYTAFYFWQNVLPFYSSNAMQSPPLSTAADKALVMPPHLHVLFGAVSLCGYCYMSRTHTSMFVLMVSARQSSTVWKLLIGSPVPP